MKPKNRNIIVAVAVVTVVLLGAWLSVKSDAEKEARNAIYDSPLDDLIEFSDLSDGVFDKSVTLYDIELSGVDEDKAPVIEAITLVGFDQLSEWLEEENDFPEVLSVRVSGVKYNLHEMLKNQALSLQNEGPLKLFALYGYQTVNGGGGVQIRYNKDDQLLSLKMWTDADDVAGMTFESELSNIREKLLESFRLDEGLKVDSLDALGGMWSKLAELQKNFGKVALKQFSVEYDDNGLMERQKYFDSVESLRLPGEKGSSVFDEESQKEAVSNLVDMGIPKSFAMELANKVAEFVENPGTIKVSTDIDSPIRFSKLTDSKSPAKFFKRLNLEVD